MNGTQVSVDRGLLAGLADAPAAAGGTFVLTDAHVAPLLPPRLMRHPHLVLAPGEARKNWTQLGELLLALDAAGIDRDGELLAIGGGVVTDLGGLAASLHRRGLEWTAVPTTLVGQVDAALGGKTAVNHGRGKNSIGTFHAPARLLADPTLLATLPRRELAAGMAEVLKTALISGEPLLARVERIPRAALKAARDDAIDMIRDCLAVKADLVARDPYDRGARRLLNLGHTFGHALESAAAPDLLHGEAVGLGLLCAARLGSHLPGAPEGLEGRLRAALEAWELPVAWSVDLRGLADRLRRDKKRTRGAPVLIAVKAPGALEILEPAPEGAFEKGLEALQGRASTS